jgi:hypothetical protein
VKATQGQELYVVMTDLVDTIECTGGLIRNEDGTVAPVADPDWTDMGTIYLKACAALRRSPLYQELGAAQA